MQAAQRSALGLAKDIAVGQLSALANTGATSLSLISIQGTFPSTGFLTIYDGDNTETVAISAFSTPTLTVGATGHAHSAGTLVVATAAADAPVDYLPVTSFDGQDIITPLEDKNYRGSLVDTYDLLQGPSHGEYNTAGDFIADPFGYLAGCFFGDVATTGSSAPFSHVFSTLNTGNGQPRTVTLTDIEPVQPRAYPRCLVSALSIMFDAQKQLGWTAKLVGFNSGPVGQPTKSFTTDRIVPTWVGSTTIGGTYNPTLQSGQIDLSRNITIIDTVDGTQSPYSIWVGPVVATGKFTLVYEDETQLKNYLNNSQPSLVLDWITGASSALRELKLQITRCAYSAVQKARTGDLITLDVSFSSLANTTDAGASGGYSPVKLTLQSSKPAATYQ
jgi:hypothetical protein